jgi:hypothetical protein
LDKQQTLSFIGLRADSETHLVVHMQREERQFSSPTQVFFTDALSFEPPQFEIDIPLEPDGMITFVPAGNNSEVCHFGIDREGVVVWVTYETDDCNGTLNIVSNEVFFTPKTLEGYEAKWMNEAGETTASLVTPMRTHHSAAVLPNNNVLFLVHEERPYYSERWGEIILTGDLIIEVDPLGEVVWEWSTFDHVDKESFPYVKPKASKEGAEFPDTLDWTHANSVQVLSETDQILLSLRSQNTVLLIDHLTGEVAETFGRDGGFELVSGDWFQGQHDATLSMDSELLLFDNAWHKEGQPNSRIVRYAIDMAQRTMTQLESMDLGFRYQSGGGALPTDGGGVLACAGGGTRERGAPIQIIEYGIENDAIWAIRVKNDSMSMIYKATQLKVARRLDSSD